MILKNQTLPSGCDASARATKATRTRLLPKKRNVMENILKLMKYFVNKIKKTVKSSAYVLTEDFKRFAIANPIYYVTFFGEKQDKDRILLS
jgi:hypothetical protein